MLKWICEQLRLNIALLSKEIINKAQELKTKLLDKNYNKIHCWYCKFLKRYGFCIRSPTHIRQKLKENTMSMYKKFLKIVYNIRNDIGDLFDYDNIINMDETPIFMENIPNKTIAPKGAHDISIISHGREKSRKSVILAVIAAGNKLPVLLVFYGTPNGPKEQTLRKLEVVTNKEIYACYQKGGWADKDIFEYWYKNIFFKYKPNNDNNKTKILILDRATSHYDSDLGNIFKSNNCKYILIPPGITRFTPPLDVSNNKPFKQLVKNWDAIFSINNMNIKKPEYKDILLGINNIWKNDNTINKEIIKKSFKITGISIKLDGSENNLVYVNENLIKNFPIPEDLLENEKEILDNLEEDKHNYKNKQNFDNIKKDHTLDEYFKNEDKMDLEEENILFS